MCVGVCNKKQAFKKSVAGNVIKILKFSIFFHNKIITQNHLFEKSGKKLQTRESGNFFSFIKTMVTNT